MSIYVAMNSKKLGSREKLHAAQERMESVLSRQEELSELAKERAMSPSEKTEFKDLQDEYENLIGRIEKLEGLAREEKEEIEEAVKAHFRSNAKATTPKLNVLQNADGEAGVFVEPTQSFQAMAFENSAYSKRLGINASDLSLGRAMAAMATGNWSMAKNEQKFLNAIGSSSGATGGYVIPQELFGEVLDMARAKAAISAAGARYLVLKSDNLRVATLDTEPTFNVVPESELIPVGEMTFGKVDLAPKKIATLVVASREAIEDAPNLPHLLEHVLAAGLAAEIDRQILVGAGTDELTGLATISGIPETTGVGAPTWTGLSNAVTAIRGVNYQPTAIITSPHVEEALALQVTGNGTASAKDWLRAPSTLDGVKRLSTSAMPNTSIFVGDFTNMLVGVRSNAVLEASTQALGAFERHQIVFKITLRVDIAVTRKNAFRRLLGVTLS